MDLSIYGRDVEKLNEEMLRERANMSNNLISSCNRLLRRAKEIEDIPLLGYSYYYLADAYYLLSTDYKKFNTNLLKAIELLQSCGDFEHLARSYNLLGIDALSHGNPELALDFFLTGLRHCEEIDESSSIPGMIEFNIGQIYFDNGDVKQALSHIRTAYKGIRRNKKDSLYYRNLLYCYCFQTDCYMILDKRESAIKCIQGIESLERDPYVNKDYFIDLPVLDILMRGYHYLGEKDFFEKYADMLSVQLQNNKFPLDSMEDIYGICRFFMKIGRLGEVKRIIKNAERSLAELNIPNLKKGCARLKVEFYEKFGVEEEKNKALLEFYEASVEQEKERLTNYKFFLNIRSRLQSIEKENSLLQKRAETDPLTGLGNRYGLNKFAEIAFEEAYEKQRSLAVEILDVDNFKHYNDTYGHQMGDYCLKLIADAIMSLCAARPLVHAFRYGGDEFVLIYENMTDDDIMECANRLKKQVSSARIVKQDGTESTNISISQGIRNSVPGETNKLWDFMYAADIALYEVKEHKKGDIVLLHKA
ncbi:MAG: GGDEF domain-containing protein [Butyrivibrio sp.]|nr:GGDEF domain-containing protein [Butyrivibrio sp.]